MITLVETSPERLRAIADFLERTTPDPFEPLKRVGIRPVIQVNWDGPDTLIGYEETEEKDAS